MSPPILRFALLILILVARPGDPATARDKTRPASAGSLLAFRIVADAKHDAKAIAAALKAELAHPPEGFAWIILDPRADRGEGLVIREGELKPGEKQAFVLVKLDPQNLTERDLTHVDNSTDSNLNPAIGFRFNRAGAHRFGTLTGSHLPEDGGLFKYRLAIIVEGRAVTFPAINSVIRDAGIIELGGKPQPEEVDRLVGLLKKSMRPTPPAPLPIAVKDQDEAIRQAEAVDLPALAGTDLVEIDHARTNARTSLSDPAAIASLRKAMKPQASPPSGSLVAATVSFYRGETLLRTIWVYEGGEWGFYRQGTDFTTGSDPALWAIVREKK